MGHVGEGVCLCMFETVPGFHCWLLTYINFKVLYTNFIVAVYWAIVNIRLSLSGPSFFALHPCFDVTLFFTTTIS